MKDSLNVTKSLAMGYILGPMETNIWGNGKTMIKTAMVLRLILKIKLNTKGNSKMG